MTATKHIAGTTSEPKTGFRATLRGLLHAKGTGAPSPASRLPLLAVLGALTLAALAASAAPASAEVACASCTPWWHLTSGSRPTYLAVGAGLPAEPVVPGVDEVQEVLIGETGKVVLVSPKVTQHEIEEEEFLAPGKSFEINAATTEAEAQAGIQGLEGYGAGNVHVQRVDATHYKISFIGALAEQPIAPARDGYTEGTIVTEPTKGVLAKGGGTPGADELQEVTIGETDKVVLVSPTVTSHEIEEEEFLGSPAKSFEITTATTEAEAQAGIQGLEGYGAGNVHVERVDPTHYKVSFIGALADQPVALMRDGYTEGTIFTELTKGAAPVPPAEATDGELNITAENVGDAAADGKKGQAVTLTDVLPPNLEAVGVAGTKPQKEGDFQERAPIPCTLETVGGKQIATCTLGESVAPYDLLAPYDQLEMRIAVRLKPGATSGERNQVSISGAAGPPSSIERPITVSEAPVPFGVESYEMALEEAGGPAVTQAGAHPFQLNTTIALNQLRDVHPLITPPEYRPEVTPPALAKDLHFMLPPGLIGNPTPIPQCTITEFYEVNIEVNGVRTEGDNACPADSAVGVATVTVHEPATIGTSTITEPVFNLEPKIGEPARFGFYVIIANSPVLIDTSVRTGSDYGITVTASNITQTAAFLSSEVTFWGVPGDPRHDSQRGWGCLDAARGNLLGPPCILSSQQHPKPFLSLPTSCDSPLTTAVTGDSWAAPHSLFEFTGAFEPAQALGGCNRLSFGPEFSLFTEKLQASTPTGVTADVRFPQDAASNAQGLAASDLKSTTVVLPEGMQLNAASAGGLEACTEAQAGVNNAEEASCPNGSKLANVTVTTPVLPNPLKGAVYLASPQNFSSGPEENPFRTLLAAYLIARDPVSGVQVKLAGRGELNETTGRITLSFDSPQLPFEDAKFEFLGGERAPEATPAHCGTYTTQATFTPYSGTAPVSATSSFNITSGPGGGPCPAASLPFAPVLAAGTTNNNAASFSPLTTTISREDGEQFMNSVTLHMPPGLTGVLTGVPLCPEAQANAGTCSSASLIGHTTASVGVGKNPFTVTGGQVFLTEGYKGASFGLSILTPAVAGPFNLGNVIVRAKVEINPITAALTVTTDEIPHILKGVPLDIRHVNVTIDREHFTLNPTSCNPMSITGTIGALEGAIAPVSDPFQATNCAALQFTPTVAVATAGKASKPNGASLSFKIAYPKGALGTQSWFNEAKFTLPKQLPARLTTIQKACDSKIFEANRAACPAGSKIGTAIVHTPVLPVPLEGPVYFVSYGNAQFPEAVLVLDGYGVHIELHGETFISESGVTSATFRNTPDVPFESIEVTLPTGPFSEFGANLPHNSYNFCGQKLVMPTLLKAQNGLEIHQNTPVGVTGCPPSVSITKTAVKGNSVAVTVKLGQQGTVKITGRGLRTTTKRGLKAGTRVINVPLTAVGRAAKRHGRKLKVQASLTVAGKTGTATATLKA